MRWEHAKSGKLCVDTWLGPAVQALEQVLVANIDTIVVAAVVAGVRIQRH